MGHYKGGRQGDQCRHSGNIQVRDDSGLDSRGSNGGDESGQIPQTLGRQS